MVAEAAVNPPRLEVASVAQPELPSELRPAVPLVSAWVSQLARDLEIELALLATRADLEALLGAIPTPVWRPGGGPTRSGSPSGRLLDGEVALAFERSGGLVLEPRPRQAMPTD